MAIFRILDRERLLPIVLLGIFLSAAQCQAEEFRSWIDSAQTQTELAQSADEYGALAESEGFQAAWNRIQDDIEALAPVTEVERTKVRQFEELMDSMLSVMTESVERALNVPVATDTAAILSNIRSGVTKATSNKLRMAKESQGRSIYIVSESRDGEIAIETLSESPTDKGLWKAGLMLNRIIGDTRLPVLSQTEINTANAHNRWSLFMGNVVHDQYVWETLINGGLARRSGSFGGTLTHPPTTQLRIAHPYPVVAFSSEGSSEFTPRIAIDVIGIRKFYGEENDYNPRYAWSIVTLLPGSSDENFGWGISWSKKNYSVGVITRDLGNDQDVLTLTIGLKTAALLENTRTELLEGVDMKISDLLSQNNR